MIRVRNATKYYGNIVALDSISLDIHEGEKLAIIGPNGAGKTTLARALMGIVSLDKGKITGIERNPGMWVTLPRS